MATPSLYRRLLGDRFDALPMVLQRFHDQPGGGRASGRFVVERYPGLIRNSVATVMGMPRSGTDVPVRLQVVVEGDRERWIRQFGDCGMETIQWTSGGVLMEALGPASFSAQLVLDGSHLSYAFGRAWLCGLPLPRFLSPYITGEVDAGETGWTADVRIAAPILGELVHYRGWIEPE